MEQQGELFSEQQFRQQGPYSEAVFSEDEENVGKTERIASNIIGALLTIRGIRKRSLISGAIGAALLYRGTTGKCPLYEQLGISTKEDSRFQRPRSVHARHSVTVNRPREEVYSYWRNLENMPRIMPHIKAVNVVDERRSKWTAEVPSPVNRTLEWHSEITDDRPNELITWNSLPESPIATDGQVTFMPSVTGMGTDVTLTVNYSLQPGAIGEPQERPFNLQQIFKKRLQKELEQDLHTFKDFIEREEPTPARTEVEAIQPQP